MRMGSGVLLQLATTEACNAFVVARRKSAAEPILIATAEGWTAVEFDF